MSARKLTHSHFDIEDAVMATNINESVKGRLTG